VELRAANKPAQQRCTGMKCPPAQRARFVTFGGVFVKRDCEKEKPATVGGPGGLKELRAKVNTHVSIYAETIGFVIRQPRIAV
jgi:hypothetical protein